MKGCESMKWTSVLIPFLKNLNFFMNYATFLLPQRAKLTINFIARLRDVVWAFPLKMVNALHTQLKTRCWFGEEVRDKWKSETQPDKNETPITSSIVEHHSLEVSRRHLRTWVNLKTKFCCTQRMMFTFLSLPSLSQNQYQSCSSFCSPGSQEGIRFASS